MLSDIHGNLTALEAVVADLQYTAPDLVLHGGDLADAGSSPVEIVDRVRGLRWQGVMGNTDEMLARPESLDEFASTSKAPPRIWEVIRTMAEFTREKLGEERLTWLRRLPHAQTQPPIALVHATPESCWRTPPPEAADTELASIYGKLGQPIAVHGHTHLASIRGFVVDAGSVGLPYDGDPRASYLLMDDKTPSIRRVEYDREKELAALASCGIPHADWTAAMLRASSPLMPS